MAKEKVKKERPFAGRIALVCGGSLGIGKETALEIVRLGGSVCLVARHAGPLQEAAEEIAAAKGEAAQFVQTIACDATDEGRLRPLLAAFIVQRGVPDYLFNCVGQARPGCVQDLTTADFRQRMEINYSPLIKA